MNVAITAIHNFLRCLTGFSLKKPGLFVGFTLIFTAFAGWFLAANITIRTNPDEMIDPNLPFRVTYDDFNRTFPQFADSFIIVIDGNTPESAESAQRQLYAALLGQTNLYSNVFAPGLGDYFETNAFLLQDYEKLLQMTDELAAAQPVLAAVSEDQSLRGLFGILNDAMDETMDGDPPNQKLPEVLADFTEIANSSARGQEAPLSWQSIFLEDEDLKKARRRLILVQPVLDFTKLLSAKEALLAARAAAAEITAGASGVTIRFSGKMALNADELKSVSDGAMVSGILSFFLVALVLGLGIRSIRIVASALITLFIGLVWTGAFAMITVGYFNIISIAFAVLFIGLGIDFAIHFALRFQEEAGSGTGTDEALIKTAVTAGTPLALCAPTTALAFFAFVPTDYAGLAQLGLISGTGIFVAFFTSMTVLPALLKLMHIRKKKIVFNRRAKAEAGFIAKNGRNIAIAGFLLGGVALVVGLKVSFDFDPINLKDPETESVTSFFDLLEGEKTSPYAIQVVAADGLRGEALKNEIKRLASVDDVITLLSYLPKDQEDKLEILDTTYLFMTPVFMNAGIAGPSTDQENQAAISTFIEKANLLFAELPDLEVSIRSKEFADALETLSGKEKRALFEINLFTWFPTLVERISKGLEPTEVVTADDIPPELRERYQAEDGRYRLEVFSNLDLSTADQLEAFVAEVSAHSFAATGSPVQIYNAGLVVKGSMEQASITAAIFIIIFLGLILRRAQSVALIVIPVLLAGALTTGAMVIFGLKFNFANVIVIPLLIGLGVDSGIHLVLRAREVKGQAKLLSSSTPKAVLLSALTTIGSFGTLAISAHQGTASMGILLSLAIVMILVATLLVLPGLLIWIEKAQKPAKN